MEHHRKFLGKTQVFHQQKCEEDYRYFFGRSKGNNGTTKKKLDGNILRKKWDSLVRC